MVIAGCQGLLRVNDKCEAGLCHAPLAPSSTKRVRRESHLSKGITSKGGIVCWQKEVEEGSEKKSGTRWETMWVFALEEATKEERFLGSSPAPALL